MSFRRPWAVIFVANYTPISPALEECLFHHGIALFHAQKYFEAHEVWEHVWRGLGAGEKKRGYQVLIQAAVCLEHYRRRNALGAVRMYRRMDQRMEHLPAVWMGVDLTQLKTEVGEAIAAVLGVDRLPERGKSLPPMTRTPQVRLVEDVFGKGREK